MKPFSRWTAPYLDDELVYEGRHILDMDLASESLCAQISSLFQKLGVLENMFVRPSDNAFRYLLYFRLNRGSFSSYRKIKEGHGGDESEKDALRLYKRLYPRKWKWYSAFFFREVYRGDAYCYIRLGHKLVLNVFDGKGKRDKTGYKKIDKCPWIKPLAELIDQAIESIRKGTYAPFVEKNLDYRLRNGEILLKDYWAIYPEEGKKHFSRYEGIDIPLFAQYASEGRMEQGNATHFQRLSANGYCRYFKIITDALGMCQSEEWTLQQHYRLNSDGRTQGLDEIDGDSEDAFDEWYDTHKWGFDHTFDLGYGKSGGGGSLRIEKDEKGYYLWLLGGSYSDEMRTFLALAQSGVFAHLTDPQSCLNAYRGDHCLYVESEEESSECDFPTKRIRAFIKAVAWEEIALAKLKGEGN